jgi:hypothetical protein
MPTVARFGSLRIVVYPNDRRLPHAHILGRGLEAIFILNCPGGPPELRANYGFSLRELNDMLDHLQQIIERTCDVWRHFHGLD